MATTSLSKFWRTTLMVGAGFDEGAFSSNPDLASQRGARFDSFVSRTLRYQIFWAHFEGNVYRKIHRFQPNLKKDYGLYSDTRSVLSPTYRIGEFWAEHLFGGLLDNEVGDGSAKPNCLPILTQSPKEKDLRWAISLINRWSNWQIQKDVFTRMGAVLGDVAMIIHDDPKNQRVQLKVIHPGTVKDVQLDSYGNCKGYTIEEWRPDPRYSNDLEVPPDVCYTEIADRVGSRVRYRTYLDGDLHDWRSYADGEDVVGPEWTEEYGFIPFIWHKHRDVGLKAGWSEFQPSLPKLYEVDDLASKIDDQVRKMVDCPWLFKGVKEADITVSYDDNGDGSRSTVPLICTMDAAANAQPLVAPLNIADASDHCFKLLEQVEKNHEELKADIATSSGDASGRALRVARQRVESRVVARRAGYDDALVRAYKMAISIGAQKRYPGFEAFTAQSFKEGELDIAIGPRPVFEVNTAEKIEERTAFWEMVDKAVATGMPLELVLEEEGWPPDKIARILKFKEAQQARAEERFNNRLNAAEESRQFVEKSGGDQLGEVA